MALWLISQHRRNWRQVL